MATELNRHRLLVGFAAVLGVLATIAAFDVRRSYSVCADEPKHLATGLCARELGAFVARDGTPLSAVWTLPFDAAERALTRSWDPAEVRIGIGAWSRGTSFLDALGHQAAIVRARTPSLVLFVLLLLLVAWAGASLAGPCGAFGAIALTVTSPTLLSHSGLVSTDLLAMTASLAFAVAMRAFQRRGGAVLFAVVAITSALAIAAKLTCVAIVAAACVSWALPRTRSWRRVALGGMAALIGLVLADGLYRLVGTSLQEPIDASRALAAAEGHMYFLGALRDPSRWFYAILLAAKSTPLFLAAIAAALVALVADRSRRAVHFEAWTAYGLPALALLTALSISDYVQGYRYLLPMVPLLALTCAPTIAALYETRRRWIGVGVTSAVLAQAVATASTHPDYIPYWNLFAGGMDGGSRIAVDSNVDWGQSLLALDAYAARHGIEHTYGLHSIATPIDATHYALPALGASLARGDDVSNSLIAVSVTYVRIAEQVSGAGEPFAEFLHTLTRIPPDAIPGHNIYVWSVTPEIEAAARAQLAAVLKKHD